MDPNELEDSWWPKETPGTFEELPLSSRWICVSYCPPGSTAYVTTLKVFSEGETYEFPAVYTAVFMLLDFQQLSCLSEIKTLPRGTAKLGRNLRNIAFLDNLRRHLLEESRGLDPSSRDICQIMKRWVLRLVNGVSNSKTHRRMEESVLTNVYSEFELGLDWKRVLLDWMTLHQRALIEAADIVFPTALAGHWRIQKNSWSRSNSEFFFSSVLSELKMDHFINQENPLEAYAMAGGEKRKRGRPRKLNISQENHDEKLPLSQRTRSAKTLGTTEAAIEALAAQPAITSSPKKAIKVLSDTKVTLKKMKVQKRRTSPASLEIGGARVIRQNHASSSENQIDPNACPPNGAELKPVINQKSNLKRKSASQENTKKRLRRLSTRGDASSGIDLDSSEPARRSEILEGETFPISSKSSTGTKADPHQNYYESIFRAINSWDSSHDVEDFVSLMRMPWSSQATSGLRRAFYAIANEDLRQSVMLFKKWSSLKRSLAGQVDTPIFQQLQLMFFKMGKLLPGGDRDLA